MRQAAHGPVSALVGSSLSWFLLLRIPTCINPSERSLAFQSGRAPVITIFDHRGCQRGGPNAEYTGPKSNDQDDEMCVKVQSKIIGANNNAKAIAQVDVSTPLLAKCHLCCSLRHPCRRKCCPLRTL